MNLSSCPLPIGLTTIRDSAFSGCSKLKNIDIPKSVSFVGSYAFSTYSGETENGITYIDNWAIDFEDSATATLRDGTVGIAAQAFYDSTELKSVTIPSSVKYICNSAFAHSDNLRTVFFEGDSSLECIGDFVFYDCDNLVGIEIPDSVKKIGEQAFALCYSLNTVSLGNEVLYIGNHAFNSCPLTEITIPDSVKHIGDGAFARCTALTEITIPESVTTLGYFSICSSLKSVVIGKNVSLIEYVTFSDCEALEFIFYTGTEAQWEQVYDNSISIGEERVYYYSAGRPTQIGNYWHYVDGVPTIWEVSAS